MNHLNQITIKTLLLISSVLLFTACEDLENWDAPRVKRVIIVNEIPTEWMELENGSRYGMGENLYNRLITKLKESEHFTLIVTEDWQNQRIGPNVKGLVNLSTTTAQIVEMDPSDRFHFEFAPIAAADFSASIEGLTFSNGSRGVRTFNGFVRDFRNPWNSGELESRNEFPPRSLEFVRSWYGNTFDEIGSGADSTIAGVDAGLDGEFNIIVASIHYKRDKFESRVQLNTRLKLLAEDKVYQQEMEAIGNGFLFAFGLSFQELSIEFGLVKNDARSEAFNHSVKLLTDYIISEMQKVPFRTKVEVISDETGIIINAGRREGIQAGDIFYHKVNGEITKMKVREAYQIGSWVEVIEGDENNIREGNVVVFDEAAAQNALIQEKIANLSWWDRLFIGDNIPQKEELQMTDVPDNQNSDNRSLNSQKLIRSRSLKQSFASLTSAQEPEQQTENISQKEKKSIHFDTPQFSLPNSSDEEDILNLKSTVLLPWLLYRYTQYDQEIETDLEPAKPNNIIAKAQSNWNLQQINLAQAWQTHNVYGAGVKIAVIDSGIDYNHENLHSAIDRDQSGWDFFSNDERAFDDNSHGTAIAGIIAAQGIEDEMVGLAPEATLLSYKVFNPYGETSSAKIYGAFERAIKDGAKIIIAAWDTRKYSEAIEAAIYLAAENNVLVVAAAGDHGQNIRNEAHYPAVYGNLEHVITVAALNKEQKLSQKFARFSNYGLGYVSIAAPGEDLEVLAPRNNTLERSGSDLAAAHVAGTAALLLSKNQFLNATDLKNAILEGAQKQPKLADKISSGRVLNTNGALLQINSLN